MSSVSQLITIFNQNFLVDENTRLVKGTDEPIYLPASKEHANHQIIFAHGFFASALHETAHWCIAGAKRRLQVDYGYWYEPDTRTADSQHVFVGVEAKPQALEWIFSKACNRKFVISLDNPDANLADFAYFKQQVVNTAQVYQQQGLPARGMRFYQALQEEFNGQLLTDMVFSEEELWAVFVAANT